MVNKSFYSYNKQTKYIHYKQYIDSFLMISNLNGRCWANLDPEIGLIYIVEHAFYAFRGRMYSPSYKPNFLKSLQNLYK